MDEYEIGQTVLIMAKIAEKEHSKITDGYAYFLELGSGYPFFKVWAHKEDILGLAADLLPKREPQVGDWVMVVDHKKYCGKARLEDIYWNDQDSKYAYQFSIWGMRYWITREQFTPTDPPTDAEILAMVKGK